MTTDPNRPDMIWIRSDTMPDGSYAVSLDHGPDLAWTFTEGAALRHALACFQAAHTAEHDAAVVALLAHVGLDSEGVGLALRELRASRGPITTWPSTNLQWDPRVTPAGKPFLATISKGAEVGQASPGTVREHAAAVLAALQATRLDTNLLNVLQRTFAVDGGRARAVVHDLQHHWPDDPWPDEIAEATEAAVSAVAGALDEAIAEFVDIRGSDCGYEADPRAAARLAVEALLAAGWRPR